MPNLNIPRTALLLLCFSVVACTPKTPPPPAPRPTLVREITQTGAQDVSAYTGEVRARYETDMGFRISGKVLERKVDLGAKVSRGDILARLDPNDVNLSATAAQASVAAAESDVQLARAELDRAQGLFDKKFISASSLDAKRTTLQAAQAKLRQAHAQADVAKNQATYANLVADRDGVITATSVEAGQVVSAGQVVFKLANPAEKEVLIYVTEGRQREMRVGREAQAHLWSDPTVSVTAVVREVAPAADPATRTYAVRLTLPKDDRFSLGATSTIIFPEKSDVALLLPLPAVVQHEGKTVVWLMDAQNTVHPTPVNVKSFREDGVLVDGGLKSGDRVVIAGAHALIEGQKVNPISESAPPTLDIKR